MKSIKSVVWVLLVVLAGGLFGTQQARAQWVPIDAPGAFHTYAYGIDAGNIVGQYFGGSGSHGFLYDGTNWTNIDLPGAYSTTPMDLEGTRIVGVSDGLSTPHASFEYDGTTWGTLAFPGAPETTISAMDSGRIVGYHGLPVAYHGFFYDGTNWTSLDAPGASMTYAQGIDMDAGTGGVIVGYGRTGSDYGWLYDIDTAMFTPFYGPGGVLVYPFDIEGNNVIGWYRDAGGTQHGFLYNGTAWTMLDFPGAESTFPFDIDGDRIVGYYNAPGGQGHGFLYEIPAVVPVPGAVVLAGLGVSVVGWLRRRRTL